MTQFYKWPCIQCHVFRQIEILTDQRIQQKLESGQKVETVKKDGERKLSRMKQKLNMEQKKSKQKEDEIDNLKA